MCSIWLSLTAEITIFTADAGGCFDLVRFPAEYQGA
jgi:hypothetical protein